MKTITIPKEAYDKIQSGKPSVTVVPHGTQAYTVTDGKRSFVVEPRKGSDR
jgi:hypothetical protein